MVLEVISQKRLPRSVDSSILLIDTPEAAVGEEKNVAKKYAHEKVVEVLFLIPTEQNNWYLRQKKRTEKNKDGDTKRLTTWPKKKVR